MATWQISTLARFWDSRRNLHLVPNTGFLLPSSHFALIVGLDLMLSHARPDIASPSLRLEPCSASCTTNTWNVPESEINGLFKKLQQRADACLHAAWRTPKRQSINPSTMHTTAAAVGSNLGKSIHRSLENARCIEKADTCRRPCCPDTCMISVLVRL